MRHGAFLLLVRLYSIENKEQEGRKIKKKEGKISIWTLYKRKRKIGRE